MLMTFDESINACKNIDDWKFVTSFSVGGFEWAGFSKENPNKLIIISSQKRYGDHRDLHCGDVLTE